MCKEVFQLSCRPRKQRWGPRWLPKDGHLQAHSFAGNLSLFTVCFEHLNIWKTFAPFFNEIASQEKSKVLCAGCMSLQREQRRKLMPAVETNLVSTCWDWLRIREPRNLEMGYELWVIPKKWGKKSHKSWRQTQCHKKNFKKATFFLTCSFTTLSFSTAVQANLQLAQGSGWTSRVGRWRLAGILKGFFFYQFGKVAARWGRGSPVISRGKITPLYRGQLPQLPMYFLDRLYGSVVDLDLCDLEPMLWPDNHFYRGLDMDLLMFPPLHPPCYACGVGTVVVRSLAVQVVLI